MSIQPHPKRNLLARFISDNDNDGDGGKDDSDGKVAKQTKVTKQFEITLVNTIWKNIVGLGMTDGRCMEEIN